MPHPRIDYRKEDAPRIKREGIRMVKVAPIWVERAPAGTVVLTREGELTMEKTGWVATDGKTVWPIADDFLAENYREEPTNE